MDRPESKYHQSAYRRHLPHFQGDGRPLFVTFSTRNHWILPEEVRTEVLEHCLFDHQRRIQLRCAIVMPDHVHIIFWALHDKSRAPYSLEEIMNGIKGASAHTVNRILKRRGSVWLEESFDHVLRSGESLCDRVHYIRNNPVRKQLVKTAEEWPWYWAEPGPSNYVPRKKKGSDA